MECTSKTTRAKYDSPLSSGCPIVPLIPLHRFPFKNNNQPCKTQSVSVFLWLEYDSKRMVLLQHAVEPMQELWNYCIQKIDELREKGVVTCTIRFEMEFMMNKRVE